MLPDSEHDLASDQAEMDAAVEAMLFADLARGEIALPTHAAWCTQVDSVVAAAKTRLPDHPDLHASIDRTAGYMKSSAYLEEQRDATLAEYDAYARYGGSNGGATVGEQTRLERLQAELDRLDALVAGAKTAETKAGSGACMAMDVEIDAAIRASLIGAAWSTDAR